MLIFFSKMEFEGKPYFQIVTISVNYPPEGPYFDSGAFFMYHKCNTSFTREN